MRYAIYSEDKIDYQIGLILKKEIERFDVRSSVSLERYSTELTSDHVDAVIFIGVSLPRKKVFSIPHYFLYMSYRDNVRGIKFSRSLKVITDLNSNTTEEVEGSPLFDLFRNKSLSNEFQNKKPYILILKRGLKSVDKKLYILRKTFKSNYSNHDIMLSSVDDVLENPHAVKEASAAVTSCALGEMLALHYNVPFVRLTRKPFFSSIEKSILNLVAGRTIVKQFPLKSKEKIIDEINKCLNDHQYNASLMFEFQTLKERVSRPMIRNFAKKIVESLEY
ncbi:MAG: hypothetical protein AB8B73_02385 [Ekhidna sp.]